jgi:predicted secreted hydrolase
MFYNLRLDDGSQDPKSAGTVVAADGRYRYLPREDIDIAVTDTWESPRGGLYPAGWRLRLASADLDITVTPILDDQELSTIVRYWEGAVDVSGRRSGQPVSGVGYVELTGYAEDGD